MGLKLVYQSVNMGVRVGSRQTLGLIWVPFKHDQSQITYITCPNLVKFGPLLGLNVQFHKLKTSRKQGSSWIDILLTLVVVPQRAAQIRKRNEFRNLFLPAMDLVSCRNFRRMTPNGPPPSNFKWGVINQTAIISFIYPAGLLGAWVLLCLAKLSLLLLFFQIASLCFIAVQDDTQWLSYWSRSCILHVWFQPSFVAATLLFCFALLTQSPRHVLGSSL